MEAAPPSLMQGLPTLVSTVGEQPLPPIPPEATAWSRLLRYPTALLDLIYPRRCESCDMPLAANRSGAVVWLCDACSTNLSRIKPPYCDTCGQPYEGALTSSFRCGNCADLKLHFDFAVSAHHATGIVRDLVHRFKYQRQLRLRGVLACLLREALEDPRVRLEEAPHLLVPVPLFHARRREREFNQAWELCRELSRRTHIPALEALARVRATTPQARLSRHQRIKNIRGAFRLRSSVVKRGSLHGVTVLLVDDVLTTGSTASECARALRREAGVEKVVVITVARG
ncbi:MAG: ComF family protein [Roseimicrobium sp.]